MRVLLDQLLDRRRERSSTPTQTSATVTGRGWGGLEMGRCCVPRQRTSTLVTMDRRIPHQQNLRGLAMGIVLVRAFGNRRADTAPLIPQVDVAVRAIRPGEVIQVYSREF